eukprot:7065633-Alexandrium_andersonii.AAC.1
MFAVLSHGGSASQSSSRRMPRMSSFKIVVWRGMRPSRDSWRESSFQLPCLAMCCRVPCN